MILLDSALTTLRRLGWQAGDSAYVVIDDTQKKKRGKKMDAVSKIFLDAEKVYAQPRSQRVPHTRGDEAVLAIQCGDDAHDPVVRHGRIGRQGSVSLRMPIRAFRVNVTQVAFRADLEDRVLG